MISNVLQLYLFLQSPEKIDAPDFKAINEHAVEIETIAQPKKLELFKAYNTKQISDLFSYLKTPQAHINYQRFLVQLTQELKHHGAFESILNMVVKDHILSIKPIIVFELIIYHWQTENPDETETYQKQQYVQLWLLDKKPLEDEHHIKYINNYFEVIKKTLSNVDNSEDILTFVIDAYLQEPHKLMAYTRWLIEIKEDRVQKIIQSNLFHWFLIQHIDRVDVENDVFQTFYQLLQLHILKDLEKNHIYAKLLSKLTTTQTHCVRGLPRTLTGKKLNDLTLPFEALEKPPRFKLSNEHSTYAYYDLFSHNYLIKVLGQKKIRKSAIATIHLNRILNSLPEEEMIQCLRISISENNMNNIGKQLHANRLSELLLQKHWISLNFISSNNVNAFSLLEQKSQQQLLEELKTLRLSFTSISNLKTLYEYINSDDVYIQDTIFEVMLKNFIKIECSISILQNMEHAKLIAFFRENKAKHELLINKVSYYLSKPFKDELKSISSDTLSIQSLHGLYRLRGDFLHAHNELDNLYPDLKRDVFKDKAAIDVFLIEAELSKHFAPPIKKILTKLYGCQLQHQDNLSDYLHIFRVLQRMLNRHPGLFEINSLLFFKCSVDESDKTIELRHKIELEENQLVDSPSFDYFTQSPPLLKFVFITAIKYNNPALLYEILNNHPSEKLSTTILYQGLQLSARINNIALFIPLLNYIQKHHTVNQNRSLISTLVTYQRHELLRHFSLCFSDNEQVELRRNIIVEADDAISTKMIKQYLFSSHKHKLLPCSVNIALQHFIKQKESFLICLYLQDTKLSQPSEKIWPDLIELAQKTGCEKTLQALIENMPSSKLSDNDVFNILTLAAEENQVRFLKIFIPKFNFILKTRNRAIATALNEAAKYSEIKLISLYLALLDDTSKKANNLYRQVSTAINYQNLEFALEIMSLIETKDFTSAQVFYIAMAALEQKMIQLLYLLVPHLYGIHLKNLSNKLFHFAITHDDQQIMDKLLIKYQENAPINFLPSLVPVFELTGKYGHIYMMKHLLLKPKQLTTTAVHLGLFKAAQFHQIKLIETFLCHDMHINYRRAGISGILHGATETNAIDSLETLLSFVHPGEITSEAMQEVLPFSVRHSSIDVLRLLLDSQQLPPIKDKTFIATLDSAINYNNIQAVNQLLFRNNKFQYPHKHLKKIYKIPPSLSMCSIDASSAQIHCQLIINKKYIIQSLENYISQLNKLMNSCFFNLHLFNSHKGDLCNEFEAANWLLLIINEEIAYSYDAQQLHQSYLFKPNSKLKKIFEHVQHHEILNQLFRNDALVIHL